MYELDVHLVSTKMGQEVLPPKSLVSTVTRAAQQEMYVVFVHAMQQCGADQKRDIRTNNRNEQNGMIKKRWLCLPHQ